MTQPLLSVRNLRVSFATGAGSLRVVDGVDFDVGVGEIMGLVGESGSGKSVTLRAILRLLGPKASTQGSVRWRGTELAIMPEPALRRIRGREIAIVFQEPMAALNPVLPIGVQITESLGAHLALRGRAARARAAELLGMVGIADARKRLDAYPHEFSGGMRQRVMIAIALAGAPKLLLADEPTTALDVTIQDQVLKLLLRLRRELDMSIVLVTHDLSVVAQTCDRAVVFYAGRTMEAGQVADVFRRPAHAYTLGLLGAVPAGHRPGETSHRHPGRTADGFIVAGRLSLRAALRLRRAGIPVGPARSDRGGARTCVRMHPKLPDPRSVGQGGRASMTEPLITLCGLTKHFARPRSLLGAVTGAKPLVVHALNGVDLVVRRGETLAVVGESACGKSTLARCLVGLHTPDEGRIVYDGIDVGALAGSARRNFSRRVQMVFQDPYGSLNPRKSIGSQLAEPIRVHGLRPARDIDERVRELLLMVGLPAAAAGRFPHAFSGGQRQRSGIARALALEPECLIADEIVSALDVSVQAQIINLLILLHKRLSLTIVFVSHDLALVRYLVHRVAVMYLGRVVEFGLAEDLFDAPRHPYTAALIAASPSLDVTRRASVDAVAGELPSPLAIPTGCAFHPRCPRAIERCVPGKAGRLARR